MEEELSIAEKGSIFEEFKEADEVKGIIKSLPDVVGDQVAVEIATERFLYIIDQYQEQPHLLDPHLESMISLLLNFVRNSEPTSELLHLAFKLLYFITKTRGFKIVICKLPHEVVDVEPVLDMLEKQDPMDCTTWETRYMLLLWLSAVSMIPFDLCRLDSTASGTSTQGRKSTMDRIMDIGKKYLDVADKSCDAACYMLSRFMTRVDVKEKKLAEYLDFALMIIRETNCNDVTSVPRVLGHLRTLHLLFKHGKREDLVQFATAVLTMITSPSLNMKNSSNTAVRKLAIKLIQRLGLTFLKARVASWRYQRGSRTLADNLNPNESNISEAITDLETEEDYEIPDELEDVIDELLIGLKDKDTVVRWSAAKGIGRILGRLPKDLADEVVGSIMGLFTVTESDAAWHGGCLALAELGRRGLLLPQRLSDVVPVIIKALVYDQQKGNFSVGAHVRDAACYVCWAFARAYNPEEIKPFVDEIARALVIVSVFDREINVRRAASAAFQENVGRQGQFPHGIDILTTCDYFAVGNRNTCYLSLSVFVAQFPEYTKALIDHLLVRKINHWDQSIRELSAEALYVLTPSDPDYMSKHVIPQLVSMATGIELSLRHGAVLSIAFIIHALAKHHQFKKGAVDALLGKEIMSAIENITHKIYEAKLFRGVGGELMFEAVCCLIKKLSLSHIQFHDRPIIELWQKLINASLERKERDVQAAAVEAIPAFVTEYYLADNGKVHGNAEDLILSNYLSQLKNSDETVRCGYTLALGAIPRALIVGHFDKVLTGLIEAAKLTEDEKRWAEARRDAIKAITSLCLAVGVDKDGECCNSVCRENIGRIYDTFFSALDDYTLDNRGDVGAWVREASMTGLHEITSMLAATDVSLVSDDVTRQMFCSIIQQACEKIDHTRAHAGEIFSKLLYLKPTLKNIPQRHRLTEIFPESEIADINWRVPGETFPKFTQLLSIEDYLYNTLLGLTVSVGGLTESLVKYSAASLLDYLKSILDDRPKLEMFTNALIKVMKDYKKNDRVTLPGLKMIEQLQCNGCFTKLAEENHHFGMDLFIVCKDEIRQCGQPQKLLASIDVFCGLLQFTEDVLKKVLSQLMIFLCHKYPKVRKTAANKLYEAMLTYDDLVSEDNLDEVLSILSETQWDRPISEVMPLRNKLCNLFHVPQPVAKKARSGLDVSAVNGKK